MNGGLKHFGSGSAANAVLNTSPVGNLTGSGNGNGGSSTAVSLASGMGGMSGMGGVGMGGIGGGAGAGGSVSGSSSNLTASSNTLAATPQAGGGLGGQCAQSPSGQFILPNNGKGHTQKGPLATHV